MRPILSFIVFSSTLLFLHANATFAQSVRIIRADRPEIVEDEPVILELVSMKIGDKQIHVNDEFDADDDWLRQLTVKVKNVSGQRLRCVGVTIGLLEKVNSTMETYESWQWGLSLYKGNCDVRKKGSSKTLYFKNNSEIDLTYQDQDDLTIEVLKRAPVFRKAVLRRAHGWSGGKEWFNTELALPHGSKFLDEATH